MIIEDQKTSVYARILVRKTRQISPFLIFSVGIPPAVVGLTYTLEHKHSWQGESCTVARSKKRPTRRQQGPKWRTHSPSRSSCAKLMSLNSLLRWLAMLVAAALLLRSNLLLGSTRSIRASTGGKHLYSIITKVRNEDPYLAEWIEYHARLGVAHFYIYDDAASSHTQRLLSKYVAQGIVTHIPQQTEAGGHKLQRDMFSHWMAHYRHDTTWASQLDVDEFIDVRGKGILLSDVLSGMNPAEICTLYISRFNFGTGGQSQRPPSGLVVPSYVWKAIDNKVSQVLRKKWIAAPQCIEKINSVHLVDVISGSKVIKTNDIYINHYSTKSSSEYLEKDIMRLRFTHEKLHTKLVSSGCDKVADTKKLPDTCVTMLNGLKEVRGTGALENGFQHMPGGLFMPWDKALYVKDTGLLDNYRLLMGK